MTQPGGKTKWETYIPGILALCLMATGFVGLFFGIVNEDGLSLLSATVSFGILVVVAFK